MREPVKAGSNVFRESNLSITLLAKDTLLYGVISGLSRLSTLLLVPILTRALNAHDYGVLDTAMMFSNIGLLVANAGIDSSIMYHYHNVDAHQRPLLVATGLWLRAGFGLVVAAVCILCAPLFAGIVFESEVSVSWIAYAFLIVPFSLVVTYLLDVLRVQHERRWFFIASLCRIVLLLLVTVWIFNRPDGTVDGFLVGRVIPEISVGVLLLALLFIRKGGSSFSLASARTLLRYGLPFVPAAVMYLLLGLVDRWFLYNSGYSASVGYYALAAKFGLIVMLFATSVQMAFFPFSMAVKGHELSRDFYARAFSLTMCSAIIIVLFLTVNLSWLVPLVGGNEYSFAVQPAGILALSSLFYVAYVFLSTGMNVGAKTSLNLVSFGAALVTATAACALLVPPFGIVGASIAIGLANIVLAVCAFMLSQRVYHVPYRVGKFVLVIAGLIVFQMGWSTGYVHAVIGNCVVILMVIPLARFLLEKNEFDRIVSRIRSFVKK